MSTPRITDEQMFRAVDANAERRRLLADAEDRAAAENLAKAKALHASLSADFPPRSANK